MYHIRKARNGEFYWLSVVRKGKSFESNARSTDTYTQKHNAEKSIVNETKLTSGQECFVYDHTTSKPIWLHVFEKDDNAKGGYRKHPAVARVTDEQLAEATFVASLPAQ